MGDREFMVVLPSPPPLIGFHPGDATYRFITQRQCPSLATVVAAPSKDGDSLMFSSHLIQDTLVVKKRPPRDARKYVAGIWKDTVDVLDMGDEASDFFFKILDQDEEYRATVTKTPTPRLVRQTLEDARRADDQYVPAYARELTTGKPPLTSLADGFPILIANEASMAELNRRLKEKGKKPLKMSNFRPNIVIKGAPAFDEDYWRVLRVKTPGADVVLHAVKGCPRCRQSCTDQITAKVSEEPLETLAEFRVMTSNAEGLYFAQNVIVAPDSVGSSIEVGNTVEIVLRGKPVWED